MWSQSQLADAFRHGGLALGDVVLVHSALRTLGPVDGGANTVIDALLEAVGPAGTIAVPTHTWKVVNSQQPIFHQALTPTCVGTLTNVFRLRPDSLRGLHPTHSVAAIGARAAELIEGHERDNTPCSPTSPYGRLRDWGGKVLIIGRGLECCTFFHGCEEWSGMPWAVSNEITQLYSFTSDNRLIPVPLYNHIVLSSEQFPRLEPELLAVGAMRISYLGDCALRVVDARSSAHCVIARLKADPTIVLPTDLA